MAAGTTGTNGFLGVRYDYDSAKRADSGGDGGEHGVALCTDGEAIGDILYVAAGEDFTRHGLQGCAYLKLRVGCVRSFPDFPGGFFQRNQAI